MKKDFLIFLDFTRKLFRDRYLLRMMTIRELKASYVGSLFGFSWAILNPLFLVLIYGVIFGLFFKSGVDPAYGTKSYLVFLLTGLVPWQFFAQTVNSTNTSITSNSSLIKKAVAFPSEILPVVTVLSNLISHVISIVLLLVVLLIFSIPFTSTMLLVLIYLFFTMLFALGVGWILASVNVFLRDTEQVLGLLMMGWFFFTPIIYSPAIVPGKAILIMKINPMYHMVEGYRLALLTGHALPWTDFLYLAVSSFVVFGIGGVCFRRLKPWFAEVL